jgi:uncharacterized protein
VSWLVRVLAGVGCAWLLVVVLAAAFQRQLIHLPDTSVPPTPDDVTPVEVTTEDGLTLTHWWLATDVPATATVLVLPGNAGNRGLRLPLARGLADRGHDVLLVEHRGYGGNPGRPDEDGLVRDAVAARDHLVDELGVAADRVVHLGESLGSSVAARLSAEAPPAALVLRSPFPSLVDVGRRHYPFLPVGTLLWDRFETARHLERVTAPALVVAGDADRIIPVELSREVAEGADAEVVVLEGVDHNDRALVDGERYLDAVDAFLLGVLDAGGG